MAKPVANRDDAAQGDAFLHQKYALDRGHELELNKFTHVFEVERLKLLLLFNGGAIGLWLGFIAPDGAGDDLFALALLVAPPVLLWIAGAGLAWHAYEKALDTQRSFAQAYHNRRRGDEWRVFAKTHDDETLAKIVPVPGFPKDAKDRARLEKAKIEIPEMLDGETRYNLKTDLHRVEGSADSTTVKRTARLSMAMFVGGVAFALAGIILA